jgi:CheY-like chemotaxis protein
MQWISIPSPGSEWNWSRTPEDLEGRRVLVVGAPATATGFLALLRRLGARVIACEEHRALALLQRLVIDVVVADPAMRDDDGRTLAQAARARGAVSAGAHFIAPPPLVGLSGTSTSSSAS